MPGWISSAYRLRAADTCFQRRHTDHASVCFAFPPSKESCENPFAGLSGPTILSRNSLIAQQLPASWQAGKPHFSTLLGIIRPFPRHKQALIIYNRRIQNASIIFDFFQLFLFFFKSRNSLKLRPLQPLSLLKLKRVLCTRVLAFLFSPGRRLLKPGFVEISTDPGLWQDLQQFVSADHTKRKMWYKPPCIHICRGMNDPAAVIPQAALFPAAGGRKATHATGGAKADRASKD